jgi:RalA-binding protein 1
MNKLIFVAGLALALSFSAQAADTKPTEKKPAVTKPAEKKPADKKPADKKPVEKKPAAKGPEHVHCDIKKDPKCKDVVKKPLTKEEREAKKKAKEAASATK